MNIHNYFDQKRVLLITQFLFLSSVVTFIHPQSLHAQAPALEIEGPGFLNAQMTSTERDLILMPKPGLLIFNTDTNCLEFFRGSAWYSLCNGGFFLSNPINELIGGNHFEFAEEIQTTSDGGSILVGYSATSMASGDISGTAPNDSGSYWVVKMGDLGNIEWERLLGSGGPEQPSGVVQTSDQGFVIGGYSGSSSSGDVIQVSEGIYDYWIVKLDKTGNILWSNLLGGDEFDVCTSLKLTRDGGFICGGYTNSTMSGDVSEGPKGGLQSIFNNDYWLLKLNAAGEKQWDKRYGGSESDVIWSVQQTLDNGYILAGSSESSDIDVTQSSNGVDFWIVKVTASGVLVWDKLFGGMANDEARSVIETADGCYLVAGSSSSTDIIGTNSSGGSDFYIIKIDQMGAIVWQKLYGGSGDETAYSIRQTADLGYIVAGNSNSPGTNAASDLWVLKLNSSGVKIWSKFYGGNGNDALYNVNIKQTSDLGFIVASSSSSAVSGDITDMITPGVGDDIWILRLDANGNIQQD